MKKMIALLLILCVMAGMLIPALGEEDARFASQEYTFYITDEDPDYIDPMQLFFFDDVYDLPWLDVEELCDLLNVFQQSVFNYPDYQLDYIPEDDTVTLKRENGYTMILDFEANTITFIDYNAFLMRPGDNPLMDQLSYSGFNAEGEVELFQRDARASFDRYGDEMVLDLGAYNIELIHEGERYYIPLQTANDFLFSPMYQRSILFNGEAMFFACSDDLYDRNTDELKPLGEIYYSVEPTERSQELADYGYNELSLMLDSLYGLKEQHNIEYFNQMFWQVGFDEALDSTSARDADTALKNFINYYLDDLHSGFSLPSWMTGPEYIDSEDGPSARLDAQHDEKYSTLRSEGMGDDWLQYEEVGNTAYITFDHFYTTYRADYYAADSTDELAQDTIGLIIYARQQIYREDSPIENVVIDLSNNYGGEVDAAVFLISWIVGEAEVSLEDTFTGAQSTLMYRADVNLDRRFDDQDTLKDKHVYCLISPVSFSCGNLVPAVCKYHQAVTLIGRTSGGGACTVQPVSTAWGTLFQISGSHRLSFRKNGSFYDIDEGVEPDIYIDHLETLYDRQALTDLINRLD